MPNACLEPLPVVIPFAEELTFRTDQVRYRRDHAKYLALIASITLLRQYQRKRITRHGETCVVATLEDARLANQLAAATFGLRSDELLPQAQQLLDELARFVTQEAKRQDTAREAVRFTQRQLRETLCWSDRSLRRQLSRLVQLEYVLCYRTRRGNQREYQLLYDPHDESGHRLATRPVFATRHLPTRVIRPKSQTEPAALRHPSGGHAAGCEIAANSRSQIA